MAGPLGSIHATLDLSDLPPLITPSPPTNTLLITVSICTSHSRNSASNARHQNLNDPTIFQAENLQTIRSIIDQHVAIHSWAPLRSMRRIIVSFYSTEDATLIRKTLDCETIMDCRVRIYFGAETKIEPQDQHLKAPMADKQFFISPPPSPPHGWEMRNEDPPNKEVHAEDLAVALSRLHARDRRRSSVDEMDIEPTPSSATVNRTNSDLKMRSRSSTLVYHPDHAGDSPALPSISVEDTSESDHEADLSPIEGTKKPVTHTARPPVELMEQ